MLITFEGIDGSGKSVQARLLKKWLENQGIKTILTKEPTKDVIGKELRKTIQEKTHNWIEAILFSADRAMHCKKIIIPNLKRTIICDRYIHSTLAYQTAMGLEKKWLECLNKNAPKPDITICLDVKPETGMQRISNRKKVTKYENLKVLRKARKEYQQMKSEKFKIINGEKTIKEVHEEIKMIIKTVLAQRNKTK